MTRIRYVIMLLTIILLCGAIAACSSQRNLASYDQDGVPDGNMDVSKIPDAVPKPEARSAYGNPTTYTAHGHHYHVLNNTTGYSKRGLASWYGRRFQNHMTSSHERYDPWAMTAASTDLPIPSYVKVVNLENGRTVIVRVNDRGPFSSNRIIDLSYAAALKLGYSGKGTALVQVSAIDPNQYKNQRQTYRKTAPTRVMAVNKAKNIPVKIPNQLHQHWLAANMPSKKPIKTSRLAYNQHATPSARLHKVPSASLIHSHLFFVQVGAFNEYKAAQRLKQSITHLTMYATRIEPVSTGRQTVYRVRIGPLKSMTQSGKVSRQLQQHGYHQAMTVMS